MKPLFYGGFEKLTLLFMGLNIIDNPFWFIIVKETFWEKGSQKGEDDKEFIFFKEKRAGK